MRFTEKNSQNLLAQFTLSSCVSAISIALLGFSGLTHAAPAVPDAGQILQEIERDLDVKPIPEAPSVEVAPIEEAQGEKVIIKQFKFEGNKTLSESELQDALASLLNHEITITQLKGCVDIIAEFYRQKGYLATAVLPEQDITDGVVVIKLVEATFGGVRFDGEYGKDFKRVKPYVIKRMIDGAMEKGAVLNQNDLDRALSVTQKMAGFNASANYQAGEKEGTTDVLVTVKDRPLFSGVLSADNTGGRSTGRHKQTASLSLASPLGYGDAVNLVALHSEGTDYASGSYSLPAGSRGLILGMNASYLKYDVILTDESISAIKPKGEATTLGFDASYPLYISRKANANLEFNFDHKTFLNQIKGTDNAYLNSSEYKVNVATLVLSGTLNDEILAGGINRASVNLGRGRVNLDGSGLAMNPPHQQTDYEGANTQGYYNRLKWNVSRTQFLSDTWSVSLDASGQFADKNLDPSEKLYLGGANGVRAYPTSEGAGSEGYLIKLELRKYLPYNLSVSAFYDEGHITQFKNNAKNAGSNVGETLTTAGSPNDYALRGLGVSVAWSGPYNTNIKATYAHRIGDNPNPSIADSGAVYDQDGALRKDIFWLSGSVGF